MKKQAWELAEAPEVKQAMAKHAEQVEAARFHRQVERAAVAAFVELLRQLGEQHDLRYVESEVMDSLAASAWNWGVTFAEARNGKR